ncbi:MAG: hypothetical protein HQL28_04810 [Candidatus Omnitrophica bacterium]|nr:hypothetical protein [Candidatus Omnitrophota bacterium]
MLRQYAKYMCGLCAFALITGSMGQVSNGMVAYLPDVCDNSGANAGAFRLNDEFVIGGKGMEGFNGEILKVLMDLPPVAPLVVESLNGDKEAEVSV